MDRRSLPGGSEEPAEGQQCFSKCELLMWATELFGKICKNANSMSPAQTYRFRIWGWMGGRVMTEKSAFYLFQVIFMDTNLRTTWVCGDAGTFTAIHSPSHSFIQQLSIYWASLQSARDSLCGEQERHIICPCPHEALIYSLHMCSEVYQKDTMKCSLK